MFTVGGREGVELAAPPPLPHLPIEPSPTPDRKLGVGRAAASSHLPAGSRRVSTVSETPSEPRGRFLISASVTHLLLVTSRRGREERLRRHFGYKQAQRVKGGGGGGGLGGFQSDGPCHFCNNVRASVASDTIKERKDLILVSMLENVLDVGGFFIHPSGGEHREKCYKV